MPGPRRTISSTTHSAAAEQTQSSGTRTKFRPLSVLVVDDQDDNRELFATVLRDAGIVVTTAGDGFEALEIVARERPDVILLDLAMPGMDGFDTLARLRCEEHGRDAYVIVVSAFSDRASRARVVELGANAFLSKPCLPRTLLDAIDDAMADDADIPTRAAAS